MAGIYEPDPDSVRDVLLCIVIDRNEAPDRAFRILLVVQRLHHLLARTLRLAVLPLCFKFLYMRGIQEHDAAQRGGSPRRKDLSLEALLVQKRQQSRVIDMRVRQEYHVNVSHGNRDGFVLIQVRSLFHTTVDQNLFSACIKIVTASRHFMSRA